MLLSNFNRYLAFRQLSKFRSFTPLLFQSSYPTRSMATVKDSIPHIIRTAEDPRQAGFWNATLSRIEQVNSKIRLLRLSISRDGPPLRHLPGQYVDLHIPNINVVGGFTITSPPQAALPQNDDPHIELAIQDSPSNPPAAYLWRPVEQIINSHLSFRVGGSFIYPPITFKKEQCENIRRAVFVAGGVGINPIMSMISAIDTLGPMKLGGMPQAVRVLYSSRRTSSSDGEAEEVLFENRLEDIADKWKTSKEVDYQYTFFETSRGPSNGIKTDGTSTSTYVYRRITHADLIEAIGPENERSNAVVYICGIPTMTDEYVELLRNTPGLDEQRVLCEKWW